MLRINIAQQTVEETNRKIKKKLMELTGPQEQHLTIKDAAFRDLTNTEAKPLNTTALQKKPRAPEAKGAE